MSGLGEHNIGDYIEAELKEGGRLRGTIKKLLMIQIEVMHILF